MSDLVKTLLNLRSLRAFVRENMTFEQAEEAYEKLGKVLEERKEAEEQRLAELAEKQERINNIKRQMEEAGISFDELAGVAAEAKPKKEKKSVAPVYKTTDEEGKLITWSGRGRTPLAFLAMSKEELEACKIPENERQDYLAD